ncbi:MAG: putative pyruvate formate lyase activating enzyme [Thermotogota bacterium]|nr:putative pyruvate formate lyase activating enzyme [Thermotogota bacterium]MDK2864715.1 putative pyruvate formate lyase activating enzyme [Thermotogota bacterium]
MGRGGSGTIFFTGCNLKCVFCQNYEISQLLYGREITLEDLRSIARSLEINGAENVNLVTPTHQVAFILESFSRYGKPDIPVVYNCGGYEKVETLKLLENVVDIYMPDFKYGYDDLAKRFSGCGDYVERALEALEEMVNQQPAVVIENGVMKKGVLVRHLILPGYVDSSLKVLELLQPYRDSILLNVMDQYRPQYRAREFGELSHPLKVEEFRTVLIKAKEMGFVLVR